MSGGLKVLAVLTVVGLGAAVAYQMSLESTETPAYVAQEPPAGASFVNEPAAAIIGAVAGQRTDEGQEAARAEYVGRWVPAEGWGGVVEEITSEYGGTLRIYEHSSTIIGGGYWILAIVGPDHGVEKGQVVRVQGQIKDVSSKSAGLEMVHRVVLENARVVGGGGS